MGPLPKAQSRWERGRVAMEGQSEEIQHRVWPGTAQKLHDPSRPITLTLGPLWSYWESSFSLMGMLSWWEMSVWLLTILLPCKKSQPQGDMPTQRKTESGGDGRSWYSGGIINGASGCTHAWRWRRLPWGQWILVLFNLLVVGILSLTPQSWLIGGWYTGACRCPGLKSGQSAGLPVLVCGRYLKEGTSWGPSLSDESKNGEILQKCSRYEVTITPTWCLKLTCQGCCLGCSCVE
jgi:hypothetical protein